jgi:hypothetical protein
LSAIGLRFDGRAPVYQFSILSGEKSATAQNEQHAMSRSSVHREITDDLLAVAVRIKRDAGIGHPEIQAVIDRFACQDRWQERTGGIGFPLVEDIPQSARGEFLAMLSDLVPHAGHPAARVPAYRLSATEIWPSRMG